MLTDQQKTERDLREIITLAGSLQDQAINHARDHIDGHSLPGGAAMINLAPVAKIARWEQRIVAAERDWARTKAYAAGFDLDTLLVELDEDIPAPEVRALFADKPDFAADEDDQTEPALQVIRFWSDHYRKVLDADWDHKPTLVVETKFLLHSLAWIADHEPNWAHFRAHITRARTHLENVVHAGRRPEKTRVVCNNPTCERPRELIRTYAGRYVTAWECTACTTRVPEARECDTCHHPAAPSARKRCTRMVGKKDDQHPCDGQLVSTQTVDHCPNPWCWTPAPPVQVWASDVADDGWKCTTCKTRYNEKGREAAHAEQLRDESAAKYVVLRDAIATLVAQGRNARVVRRWLAPPLTPVDRCTRCRRQWAAEEHNVCPRKLKDRAGALTGEECGGELERIHTGDPDAVVESYCDLTTHQTYAWWPDLWRLHLTTQTRTRRSAS